jgi:hypothetical protein
MRSSRIKGDRKTGAGACRVMRHAWGFSIEESVTQWTDGVGYSFELLRAPFPMSGVRETWLLEASGAHSTITTQVSYDMRLGAIGALLDMLLVRYLVSREMRAGLRGLKKYLEMNTTSEPLPVPGTSTILEPGAD